MVDCCDTIFLTFELESFGQIWCIFWNDKALVWSSKIIRFIHTKADINAKRCNSKNAGVPLTNVLLWTYQSKI